MLKDIFDTKNEAAVLTLFLSAPVRSFGTIELGKRLNLSSPKLTSILNQFVKEGYIKKFTKRGISYFLVNERNKELAEVKKSFLRNKLYFQDELFASIKKLGDVKAAFLSGVFTGNPELPVDLLLVGKANLTKLDKFLQNCKKMLGQEINYSVMSEDEFKLRRDTFDRFIKDIFDYRHLVVVDNLNKTKKK
jgi:DNA-binding MarR family transcriptional regulator